MVELNDKQKALLERGYTEDEVMTLGGFSKEELSDRVRIVFDRITKGIEKVENPKAIFVGGQPGCGKSSVCINIQNDLGNIILVNIDNYRTYHLNYLMIEECIKRHWAGRIATEENTPGNDLADFTHDFVSDMSDTIIERVSSIDEKGLGYNIIIEWGMRNPTVPLQTMTTLKKKGYDIEVEFVCVHKDISIDACMIRANVMDDSSHIIRKPSASFHELCVEALPDSINQIHERGYLTGIISKMKLCLRDGTVLWDETNTEIIPGDIFRKYLKDYDLTKHFRNSSDLARLTNSMEIDGINIVNEDEEISKLIRRHV